MWAVFESALVSSKHIFSSSSMFLRIFRIRSIPHGTERFIATLVHKQHNIYYFELYCSGIVLVGPSGSGKTALTEWLAQATHRHCKFMAVPCADLVHKVRNGFGVFFISFVRMFLSFVSRSSDVFHSRLLLASSYLDPLDERVCANGNFLVPQVVGETERKLAEIFSTGKFNFMVSP